MSNRKLALIAEEQRPISFSRLGDCASSDLLLYLSISRYTRGKFTSDTTVPLVAKILILT